MTKKGIKDLGIKAYEMVRAYEVLNGDESSKPFKDLNKSERENVLSTVEFILDEPKTYAGAVHDKWINFMISKGWSYGKELDVDNKKHPDMVNYRSLSPMARAKDKIFLDTVKLGNI